MRDRLGLLVLPRSRGSLCRCDSRVYHGPRKGPGSRVVTFGTAAPPSETSRMSGPVTLEALDLAALLCSRVCHDLISPVGAVVNGIEVMEDDNDAETKTFALDLIKKSARQASAKLQFCRLAFGAA